jgi:hypothetical protein
MGVEIIYPIVWLFSTAAIIWLIIRSFRSGTRPYALPTLLLSVAVSLPWAWAHHEPGYFVKYALWCFAPAVIVLGFQAHAIRWLVKRGSQSSAP